MVDWLLGLFSRQRPLKYPPKRSEWDGRIVLACPDRCTGGEINWAGWLSVPSEEYDRAEPGLCFVCGKRLQSVRPP